MSYRRSSRESAERWLRERTCPKQTWKVRCGGRLHRIRWDGEFSCLDHDPLVLKMGSSMGLESPNCVSIMGKMKDYVGKWFMQGDELQHRISSPISEWRKLVKARRRIRREHHRGDQLAVNSMKYRHRSLVLRLIRDTWEDIYGRKADAAWGKRNNLYIEAPFQLSTNMYLHIESKGQIATCPRRNAGTSEHLHVVDRWFSKVYNQGKTLYKDQFVSGIEKTPNGIVTITAKPVGLRYRYSSYLEK